MRFASLGSGSAGNALVVEAGGTRVLLDCGFTVSETVARLARLRLAANDIDAVLLTHEHSDHAAGVVAIARKFQVPVWLTHGTRSAISPGRSLDSLFHIFDWHQSFCIGDLEIEPYPVPHDACEPVQFVFGEGNRRLGVLTDTGCSTNHIERALSGCAALVLECNHDLEMLMNGPYPRAVKERIAGKFGHLDNAAAGRLLANLDTSNLQHLIAAHLSQTNNTAELARRALSAAANCAPEWIGIADQALGFAWREIV